MSARNLRVRSSSPIRKSSRQNQTPFHSSKKSKVDSTKNSPKNITIAAAIDEDTAKLIGQTDPNIIKQLAKFEEIKRNNRRKFVVNDDLILNVESESKQKEREKTARSADLNLRSKEDGDEWSLLPRIETEELRRLGANDGDDTSAALTEQTQTADDVVMSPATEGLCITLQSPIEKVEEFDSFFYEEKDADLDLEYVVAIQPPLLLESPMEMTATAMEMEEKNGGDSGVTLSTGMVAEREGEVVEVDGLKTAAVTTLNSEGDGGADPSESRGGISTTAVRNVEIEDGGAAVEVGEEANPNLLNIGLSNFRSGPSHNNLGLDKIGIRQGVEKMGQHIIKSGPTNATRPMDME